MDKEIFETIHRRIKYIWEEKIKEDYVNDWLYKEDTLKNALYYHIRTELSSLFEKNNIRIFTEFTDCGFDTIKKRPDLVIATVDIGNKESEWYSEDIKECIAVFEIKFKTGMNSTKSIYSDYDKLEKYIELVNEDCKLYMATIWECEDKPTTWIRKNAAWAKGKVTELNASYIIGSDYEPKFYVYEHK